MKCPKCGNELTEIEEGRYACPSCGARFRKKTPAPAPAKTPEQQRIEELERQLAALREQQRIQELERQLAEAQERVDKQPSESESESATADVEDGDLPRPFDPNKADFSKPTISREGDVVYFGSYPQTAVTDEAIVAVLTKAAGVLPTAEDSKKWTSYKYYFDGNNDVDYMWYIDFEYEGERYRGVYFTSYKPVFFNQTSSREDEWQKEHGYEVGKVYWFRYDPIKWRILEEKQCELLLMSELLIDSQPYQTEYAEGEDKEYYLKGANHSVYANNYEHSTIRTWLNDTFYHTAFSDFQRAFFLLNHVDNSERSTNPNDYPKWYNGGKNIYACEDTEDYVFLLSKQEVMTASYGFMYKNINSADPARRLPLTDYAKVQGASTSDYPQEAIGMSYWWLRSPFVCYGKESKSVCMVDTEGHAFSRGDVDYASAGVAPVIRIKKCSDVEPKSPCFTREGQYLYFGSYPQSRVKDRDLLERLTKAAGKLPSSDDDEHNWTRYYYYLGACDDEFIWYIDIELDGKKYRGVYFIEYRSVDPDSHYAPDEIKPEYANQYRNRYTISNVYWFSFDPIRWRILEEKNGEALILSDMILDSQEYRYGEDYWCDYYDGSNASDSDEEEEEDDYYERLSSYQMSKIRGWLNEDFYQIAFSNMQKALILRTEVDNSARSTNPSDDPYAYNGGENEYACCTTKDYLFPLSMQEVTNRAYGFRGANEAGDPARRKKTTDYAQVQGAFTYQNGTSAGNGNWWLRSPSPKHDDQALCVNYDGNTFVDRNGYTYDGTAEDVIHSDVGVAPALRLRLREEGERENERDEDSVPKSFGGGNAPRTRITITVEKEALPKLTIRREGKYVYFGSYPQSEVLFNNALKNALEDAAGELPEEDDPYGWTSYKYYMNSKNDTDYMWYIDVEYQGNKYRGVYFDYYRPPTTKGGRYLIDNHQRDNGYRTDNVYWFKYEPIKWRILQEKGGRAFLFSESILDSREFAVSDNGGLNMVELGVPNPNNYAHSVIRKWLNETFLQTAFSESEQSVIRVTTVDNSPSSAGFEVCENACEDTEDRIFLLSRKEAMTPEYGFDSDSGNDPARSKYCTSYAKAQGVWCDNRINKGVWRLRSPSDDSQYDMVRRVTKDGLIMQMYAIETSEGVAPAMWIDLD